MIDDFYKRLQTGKQNYLEEKRTEVLFEWMHTTLGALYTNGNAFLNLMWECPEDMGVKEKFIEVILQRHGIIMNPLKSRFITLS